jgi:D-tyrosyl-tRNA(Tyr) deacylase
MIVVLQRVSRASVSVEGTTVGAIGRGLLALAAVEAGDTEAEADWCARKTAEVRLFSDAAGKMNLDVRQAGGSVLAVSQFTLVGDLKKGTRPSFSHAAPPGEAAVLFERYAEGVRSMGVGVATGIFGAMMAVELVNDGPVTLILQRRARAPVSGKRETTAEAQRHREISDDETR